MFSSRIFRSLGLRWSFVLLVSSLVLPTAVFAGDAAGPAVSDHNGKFSVEGGEYDNDDSFLALGSYSFPLGFAFGLQADGAFGTIDGEVMGGGGLHLFTRDPSKYLFGVYGSYHTWNSIDIWRTAAEAEFYLDRFSLTGLAGYENVDVPTISNGLLVLNSDDGHFFGHADLAYYLTDNLMLSGGYRYVNETSLGSATAEYLVEGAGVPMSVFARGDFGDDDYRRITGGLRVYFGADPNKSLIDRHRKDDPQNYTPVFPRIRTAAPQSTAASQSTCGNGIDEGAEECDDGNSVNGDGCSATCKLEVPACGNGILEGAEQCDDGNSADGDGCSATCQIEDDF